VGHFGAPLLAHGYGVAAHGYGVGPLAYSSGAVVGAQLHTTVTKHVGVPVPAPYPVAVDRPVPYAVKVCILYK
jgi:hypothetical protein